MKMNILLKYIVLLGVVAISARAEVDVDAVENEMISRDRLQEHIQVSFRRLEQRLNDPERMEAEQDFDETSFTDLLRGPVLEVEDDESRDLTLLLAQRQAGKRKSLVKSAKRAVAGQVVYQGAKNRLKRDRDPLEPFQRLPDGLFRDGRFTRIPNRREINIFTLNRVFPLWIQIFVGPCERLATLLDIFDILPLGQLKALCPESPISRRNCDSEDAEFQAQLVCGVIIQTVEVLLERIPIINRDYKCTEACEIWYETFCSRCDGISSRINDLFP